MYPTVVRCLGCLKMENWQGFWVEVQEYQKPYLNELARVDWGTCPDCISKISSETLVSVSHSPNFQGV